MSKSKTYKANQFVEFFQDQGFAYMNEIMDMRVSGPEEVAMYADFLNRLSEKDAKILVDLCHALMYTAIMKNT